MHLYKVHGPTEPSQLPFRRRRRPRLNVGSVGWDCVRQMQMFRRSPDVLANALREMGVAENGDEILDRAY